MSMSETEKIVREELSKIIGKDTDQISKDDDLIEEKFNIILAPEKVSEMKTIGDIVNIIESNK